MTRGFPIEAKIRAVSRPIPADAPVIKTICTESRIRKHIPEGKNFAARILRNESEIGGKESLSRYDCMPYMATKQETNHAYLAGEIPSLSADSSCEPLDPSQRENLID